MRTQIGGMNNVKIFVLYLMRNINYPLDFPTINDIVMQTDFVMYLDFAVAFHEMLDGDLIRTSGTTEQGDSLYEVTDKGRLVADELKSDLLPSILDKSLAAALRYLDFKKRKITVKSEEEALEDGSYNVTIHIYEDGKSILSTSLNVDSKHRIDVIRKNFHDRPEVIYRGIIALLSGKVNYLFDKN